MKQGNQFYLEIQLEDEDSNILNIDSVSKVQFVIDDMIKIYDGASNEVTYDKDNQCFKIWLMEDETFKLDRNVKIDARILFKNDTIGGSYITETYFYSSLKQEILDDGETPIPSANLSEYFDVEIKSEIQEDSTVKGTIDRFNVIKKLPTFVITDDKIESLDGLFENGIGYRNKIKLSSGNAHIKKCSNLFTGSFINGVDLSDFDTSETIYMDNMFSSAPIKKLDLINFNTSNVVTMNSMFYYCTDLEELNIDNFDTSKVTNMAGMFENCEKLKSLNVSSFNTNNVETMYGMFSDCSGLTHLDLSSFDTSKVIDMRNMFAGCTNLKNLNLSSFDFSKVTKYNAMFGSIDYYGIPANCYILVKDAETKEWITSKFDWLTNIHYVGE